MFDYKKQFALISAAGLMVAPAIGFASTMYVHDSTGNLGTVDTTSGEVSLIGNMGAVMTDIAFDTSGELFGITISDLYNIDPATATSSFIGSHSVPGGNALVFDTNGTLYSAGSSGTGLYTIDPSSGSTSSLGNMGFTSSGDLAFVDDDFYLASAGDLVSVNLADPSASSAIGPFGVDSVFGIATDEDGKLFGVANTTVFTVDTSTGSAVNPIDFSGRGLGAAYGQSFFAEAGAITLDPAIPAPIPLPASALLLLTGLGLCGGMMKARRKIPA